MSYLLETLGRGLLADLRAAFENQWPGLETDELEDLRRRCADSPTSFDLALRLGVAALRAGRLRDAQTGFESARHLNPTSGQPLLGLACVSDELGQIDGALKYLSAAQARDPHDPAIAFGIGFCHERLGRAADARQAYRHALELCPQLRNAYERLAALAIREGDWAGAIGCYERLAELEPGDLDVLLLLGALHLQTEQAGPAIDQFQQALLIEPEVAGDAVPGGTPAGPAGLHEAIRGLEKLVQKYPGVAPFHVQLGDLYVKAGEDERALAEYNSALATQPNFLEATVKLGTQHMRRGRFADAALTFNRAVELNDRLITAFAGLGVAQHDCGRRQESLATFDLAASLEPSTTLLFSEAVRLQFQAHGRPDADAGGPEAAEDSDASAGAVLHEALRRHEQALAQAPNHADLHYRYGLLLRQVGRSAEAIAAFRTAVQINPSYSKALVKLAICLKEAGQTDEAIETFQRALKLDARFVDVHYQLGLLFAQRSQFDLAVEQFEQAAAGSPVNLSFRANLALALQSIGMVDKAAATWNGICELARERDELLTQREHILRDLNRT